MFFLLFGMEEFSYIIWEIFLSSSPPQAENCCFQCSPKNFSLVKIVIFGYEAPHLKQDQIVALLRIRVTAMRPFELVFPSVLYE